jgi:hypothetical protein
MYPYEFFKCPASLIFLGAAFAPDISRKSFSHGMARLLFRFTDGSVQLAIISGYMRECMQVLFTHGAGNNSNPIDRIFRTNSQQIMTRTSISNLTVSPDRWM